jgi:hypothetical protein
MSASLAFGSLAGGKPPVSPLSPPSDTLRLVVGEHGQSPRSRSLAVQLRAARKSGGRTLAFLARSLWAGKGLRGALERARLPGE